MKKWAVFQKKYGKDARRYVDNIDDLYDTHLEGIVREENLPVILNKGLGYTGFDEEYHKKEGFLKVVTTDDDKFPLTLEDMFPMNSKKFKWGWIDTEGNTYVCDYEDHSYAADFICKQLKIRTFNPERKLEELGWIKISKDTGKYSDKSVAPYFVTKITKAQYDTLCAIGLGDDWRVKGWFEYCEPL